MIYLIPPVPTKEPSWRLRAEYAEGQPRVTKTFTISEDVAKVLADKGVPVVLLGRTPTGATEEALVESIDEIDRRDLRVSKRMLKEIAYAIDLLGEASRLLLPQIYWECRRAHEAVREAEEQYEALHEKLMGYAYEKLGLTELDATLVEGPHECIKSPTRHCLYNDDEDPCHDDCLVCGEPEERK